MAEKAEMLLSVFVAKSVRQHWLCVSESGSQCKSRLAALRLSQRQ